MALDQRKIVTTIEIDPKNLAKVLFVTEVNEFFDTETGDIVGQTDQNRLSIYPDSSDFPEIRMKAIETLKEYCQTFENSFQTI